MEQFNSKDKEFTQQFFKSWENGRVILNNHRVTINTELVSKNFRFSNVGRNFFKDIKYAKEAANKFPTKNKKKGLLVKKSVIFFKIH